MLGIIPLAVYVGQSSYGASPPLSSVTQSATKLYSSLRAIRGFITLNHCAPGSL